MPRNDGHNPEPPRRHHKRMRSARKGSGHDARRRKAKQAFTARRPLCGICGHPTADRARHKRAVH